MQRSTKVKIIKESSSTITVKIVSLNRNMPVKRADFLERYEKGQYEVVNKAAFAELCGIEEDKSEEE